MIIRHIVSCTLWGNCSEDHLTRLLKMRIEMPTAAMPCHARLALCVCVCVQEKTVTGVGPSGRRQVINPTVPLRVPTCNIFNLSCYTHKHLHKKLNRYTIFVRKLTLH